MLFSITQSNSKLKLPSVPIGISFNFLLFVSTVIDPVVIGEFVVLFKIEPLSICIQSIGFNFIIFSIVVSAITSVEKVISALS